MQHRLTVVTTHPAQYYAPWFRCISRNCPEIELTAVHAIQPTVEQQGVGFMSWMPMNDTPSCCSLRSGGASQTAGSHPVPHTIRPSAPCTVPALTARRKAFLDAPEANPQTAGWL